MPKLQPESTPREHYRTLAEQFRERAREETLPNVRRTLEASAERWEILARSHESLARTAPKLRLVRSGSAQVPRSKAARETFRVGNLIIDTSRKVATANDVVVPLTISECRVLELLYDNRGTPVSRRALLDHLYDNKIQPDGKIIDVFVCKLRKKLAQGQLGFSCIENMRGVGYQLSNP